jgi:hypothetical protein
VLRSANTIIRIYLIYTAFRVLSRLGLAALALAAALLTAHALVDHGLGSLLLWASGASLFLSTQLFLTAVVADLLAVNRRLQEESLATLRELSIESRNEPASDAPEAEAETETTPQAKTDAA